MILTADVGNSRVKFALFASEKDRRPYRFTSISARVDRTKNEIADVIKTTLAPESGDELSGAIIGSVVPALTSRVAQAIGEVFPSLADRIVTVRPGLRTGIDIRTDFQSELGADIIANAVGAVSIAKPPIAIVDLGTAITFSLIDADRRFQGVAIMPGLSSAVRALDSDCAALTCIDALGFDRVGRKTLGKNTAESIALGVRNGAEAMIEGMLSSIAEEHGVGDDLTVVLCGGDAEAICLKRRTHVESELTSHGLACLFALNSRTK